MLFQKPEDLQGVRWSDDDWSDEDGSGKAGSSRSKRGRDQLGTNKKGKPGDKKGNFISIIFLM
jgi:hypothetical protein